MRQGERPGVRGTGLGLPFEFALWAGWPPASRGKPARRLRGRGGGPKRFAENRRGLKLSSNQRTSRWYHGILAGPDRKERFAEYRRLALLARGVEDSRLEAQVEDDRGVESSETEDDEYTQACPVCEGCP